MLQPFVLIANCDEDLGQVLREELQDHGYEAWVAVDANEALSLLRFRYHRRRLVLADVRVPDGGLELLARMKREPRLATVPVIVMSATPTRLRLPPGGVCRVLRKPFNLDVLLRCVSECIEGSR